MSGSQLRIDCARAAMLHALCLDRELDGLDAAAFDAHLQQCSSCAARFSRTGSARAALRAALTYHRAPVELRRQFEASLTAADPLRDHRIGPGKSRDAMVNAVRQWVRLWTGLGGNNGWRPLLGLVSACLAGVALALWMARPIERVDLASAISRAHVRAMAVERIVAIQSNDRHSVKPWFAGKIDFAPQVCDLSADGFDLIGGRVDALAGRTVAALVYQRRRHVITLFVWPEQPELMVTAAEAMVRGFNVVAWSFGDLRYAAISDLNAGELDEFRARFRAAADLAR